MSELELDSALYVMAESETSFRQYLTIESEKSLMNLTTYYSSHFESLYEMDNAFHNKMRKACWEILMSDCTV